MKKMKNILVPTDFSKGSVLTLDHAVEIVKAIKAELHIVHVIEPMIFFSDVVNTKYGLKELPNELELLAQKDIEKISKNLIDRDVTFSTAILHGKASEEILEYADKNHIDMICIATHGQGNIENLLFGSTAEKVLRKALCPVLSVRVKE